jgi:hypothetical protein
MQARISYHDYRDVTKLLVQQDDASVKSVLIYRVTNSTVYWSCALFVVIGEVRRHVSYAASRLSSRHADARSYV